MIIIIHIHCHLFTIIHHIISPLTIITYSILFITRIIPKLQSFTIIRISIARGIRTIFSDKISHVTEITTVDAPHFFQYNCTFILQDNVLLRNSKDPNFMVDWEEFARIDRSILQDKHLSETTKVEKVR